MPKKLKLNFGDIAVKNAGRAGGVAVNHLVIDNLLLPMVLPEGTQDDLLVGIGKVLAGAIVEESFKKEPFVSGMGTGLSVMGVSQALRATGIGIQGIQGISYAPPTGVKGHVIGNIQRPTGVRNHVMAGNPAS